MEAISNAGAAIGILATDGVVLIAEKKITSKVHQAHEFVPIQFLNVLRLAVVWTLHMAFSLLLVFILPHS